jgi:hypothetical protein
VDPTHYHLLLIFPAATGGENVVPSDARAVERYRDLIRQHSHIEYPKLLTGTTL